VESLVDRLFAVVAKVSADPPLVESLADRLFEVAKASADPPLVESLADLFVAASDGIGADLLRPLRVDALGCSLGDED
jgi:hypothetical protein